MSVIPQGLEKEMKNKKPPVTLTPKLYRLILEKSPLLTWYPVLQDTGSG
jgi:hypothetical protein